MWALLGVTYFTNGQVVAKRDWFGIVLGCVCVIMGLVGIWRALRLGVVIDAAGIRVRGLDTRDRVTPLGSVHSVECAQTDIRAGLPLYGPLIHLGGDLGDLPIRALGSYSRQDAERKVERLRTFIAHDAHP
jgi:hypothetical protein